MFVFSFPELKKLYFSENTITGNKAFIWDKNYGMTEQCEILDPLYQGLSVKSLGKLERMAKGKGIFRVGVPK